MPIREDTETGAETYPILCHIRCFESIIFLHINFKVIKKIKKRGWSWGFTILKKSERKFQSFRRYNAI